MRLQKKEEKVVRGEAKMKKKDERKQVGWRSAMVDQQKESRKIDAEIRTAMCIRSLLALLGLHKRHDIRVGQTDRQTQKMHMATCCGTP